MESEMTKTDNSSLAPWLFLFLLAAAIVIWKPWGPPILNIVVSDHAKTSHIESVPEIDNCFNGGGPRSLMFKTSYGRWAQYCNDGGPNNFWRIFECQEGERYVVTQFKQGVKRLANYMTNHKMVQGDIPC